MHIGQVLERGGVEDVAGRGAAHDLKLADL